MVPRFKGTSRVEEFVDGPAADGFDRRERPRPDIAQSVVDVGVPRMNWTTAARRTRQIAIIVA